VAGFRNSTSANLNNPFDLVVDDVGNMLIADSYNHRILYWPVNSAEGRMVAGTGIPGSGADQLRMPTTLTSNNRYCQ
jgi:hypothetical protein